MATPKRPARFGRGLGRKSAAAAAIAIASATPAMAHRLGDYASGHGWGDGHMAGGWHWILGPLMMVAVIAVIVVVAVMLVRWLGGGQRGPAGRDASSARAILDERYARGEIDRAEYMDRKKDLS